MRNRAKCKLCNSIVESFHSYDFVQCTCKEIFVDAGEGLRCGAKNWENFLRIDDEGKIIVPKIKDGFYHSEQWSPSPLSDGVHIPNDYWLPEKKPTKEEAVQALKDLIASYDNLPNEALYSPVNHADLKTILSVLQFIISM